MFKTASRLIALAVVFVGQACSPDANADYSNSNSAVEASEAGDASAYMPKPVSLDDLVGEIQSRRGDVVVVNFWATWCLPCRVEFPELVKFGNDYEDEGVNIVFVSTDFESEIPSAAQFLMENGVEWESYIKKGADLGFIEAFHKQWSGALPATFIYDRSGNLRAFWEGITSYEELEETVDELL